MFFLSFFFDIGCPLSACSCDKGLGKPVDCMLNSHGEAHQRDPVRPLFTISFRTLAVLFKSDTGTFSVSVDTPGADQFTADSPVGAVCNKSANIFRRITEKETYFMGEILSLNH